MLSRTNTLDSIPDIDVKKEEVEEMAELMRNHIEIRNRTYFKRLHRSSFLANSAVDFLTARGFAASREEAVSIGRRMVKYGLIKHVTEGSKFRDAYLYFRFQEDDEGNLAPSNAGNGGSTFFGVGGSKFSFAPHTAHNSYILDISLAQEIEKSVASGDVESRRKTMERLRMRVRELAAANDGNWRLTKSQEVGGQPFNTYIRCALFVCLFVYIPSFTCPNRFLSCPVCSIVLTAGSVPSLFPLPSSLSLPSVTGREGVFRTCE